MMKINHRVKRFAGSGILAGFGFLGFIQFVPHKGQYSTMWSDALSFTCLVLFVIGLVGLFVSFISWIVAELRDRRKTKAENSQSIH